MSDTKRLRRPSVGGYVRGDETRLRIITAAIESFGEYGFEGASTREIATRAGVNAPALQYYFENKEGVYRACAEYMADDAWPHFEPAVTLATEVLRTESDVPALIDAFVRIQEVLADRTLVKACNNTPTHRLFFAREQTGQEPSIASEILNRRIRQPLNNVCAKLIARIGGTEPDDPVTLIRLLSLHGQLMMFHIAPRTSLGLLGWTEIDAEKAELLKKTIRSQTLTLLKHWNKERLAASRDANQSEETGTRKDPAAPSAIKKRVTRK